uniref:HDC10898 n=1 Tax=Drosophila melanogaster TaxID=7227 RepID=Q6IL10_DROME|nr:TPA_inf: HDC10898 [Drosophila melanogaster]
MKSVILYPYGPLTGGTRCCRMLHAKNLAITSAIYTIEHETSSSSGSSSSWYNSCLLIVAQLIDKCRWPEFFCNRSECAVAYFNHIIVMEGMKDEPPAVKMPFERGAVFYGSYGHNLGRNKRDFPHYPISSFTRKPYVFSINLS